MAQSSSLRTLLLLLCALLIAGGGLVLGWNALTSSGVPISNSPPQVVRSPQQKRPSSPPTNRQDTVDADALSHTAVPAPSPFVENPDCGGAEALQEYVKNHPPEITWPWTATEGRVLVEFLVTEEGEVISPKIMRGVNEPLNAAALRAVNSLECEPGLKEDKPVLVQKSLLVTFRDE